MQQFFQIMLELDEIDQVFALVHAADEEINSAVWAGIPRATEPNTRRPLTPY